MTGLLERLLDYRAVMNDENKTYSMSCTVNLLVGTCPVPPAPPRLSPVSPQVPPGSVVPPAQQRWGAHGPRPGVPPRFLLGGTMQLPTAEGSTVPVWGRSWQHRDPEQGVGP